MNEKTLSTISIYTSLVTRASIYGKARRFQVPYLAGGVRGYCPIWDVAGCTLPDGYVLTLAWGAPRVRPAANWGPWARDRPLTLTCGAPSALVPTCLIWKFIMIA